MSGFKKARYDKKQKRREEWIRFLKVSLGIDARNKTWVLDYLIAQEDLIKRRLRK